jgi:hypothetical protein
MHDATVEIYASPAERQYLASAHACGEGDQGVTVDPMVSEGSQKRHGLLGGQGRHRPTFNLRQALPKGIGRVASDHRLFYGAGEGGLQNAMDVAASLGRQTAILAIAPPPP